MPVQKVNSLPGTNSAMVGTSGSTSDRVAFVAASARSLPALVSRYSSSEEQPAVSGPPDVRTAGRQDDGLAGRLRVEEPVGGRPTAGHSPCSANALKRAHIATVTER